MAMAAEVPGPFQVVGWCGQTVVAEVNGLPVSVQCVDLDLILPRDQPRQGDKPPRPPRSDRINILRASQQPAPPFTALVRIPYLDPEVLRMARLVRGESGPQDIVLMGQGIDLEVDQLVRSWEQGHSVRILCPGSEA